MRNRILVLLAFFLSVCTIPAYADRPSDQFKTTTKTATASTAQTDTTLWDPDAGKRIILMSCTISVRHALIVELEDDDGDVIPPIYFDSYGTKTFGNGYSPIWEGAVDEILTYTTSATGISPSHSNSSIVCSGYEV